MLLENMKIISSFPVENTQRVGAAISVKYSAVAEIPLLEATTASPDRR